MRAIVIREPGGPEVLELRDRPSPIPPFAHVRVDVRFAGVNRADLLQRLGVYAAPPGVPADIPGLEYAGVVSAIGEGVRRHAVGDRVFGLVAGGAYAEQLIVHEDEAVRTPSSISDRDAAAIPEAFVTAYDALVVRGGASAGDWVLVTAAASGVGTAATQIARALGCRVIGTSRSADKLAKCAAYGVEVPIVPTKDGAFADEVKKATGGRGVDVVIELVGGAYVAEDVRALASKGRIVVVGLTGGRTTEVDLGMLLSKRATIVGTVLRSRPLEEKIAAARLLERSIASLFAAGKLETVVDAVYPIARAGDAHDHVAADRSIGKVLLEVAAVG